MKLLLTGGGGFIGSHVLLCCLEAGHEVAVLDNFCNSSPEAIARVEQLAGRQVKIHRGDIRDADFLNSVFASSCFDAVMHFAGLKAVSESIALPLDYYDVNVGGSITLARAMSMAGVFRLVFSSTASVYGELESMPLSEDSSLGAVANPYGRTKRTVELFLQDLCVADRRWAVGVLRYFNPAGAHQSGRIGEDPRGVPANLIPYAMQVAIGRRETLSVFGMDYPTPDGSGLRDYIHVMDLSEGHVAALNFLFDNVGHYVWNLGAGRAYSVLEIIRGIERLTGKRLAWRAAPRRAGDVAQCWADSSRAAKELAWHARRGLDETLADHWRWQTQNPDGYASADLTDTSLA